MANSDNGFIPEVGMVFFAEKKPILVDEYQMYDQGSNSIRTIRHHRYDHSHRAVLWRCTAMDKYIMMATPVGSGGTRTAFVLKDWSYYPVSPSVLADTGLGVDGYSLPIPLPVVAKSNDREITEGT